MADAHPTQPQLLFVDGSLPELTEELGDYLQIGDEVRAHLKDNQAEEALQAIVKASSSLNSVPEAEFTPAYSLLIHLVINSKDPKRYLPVMCQNLQKPITTSPQHGTSLALFAFQSIFNFLNYDNPLRYNVWMQILKFVKQTSSWELLKWSSSLDKMQTWFKDWDTDEEGQRRMLVETAEVADDAGDQESSYRYLLSALRTFDVKDSEEYTSEEAQQLALRLVRIALASSTKFDFLDLKALPSIQALSDSQPVWSQLLDVFAEQDLEDYRDFLEEHEGFAEQQKLDESVLERKMRLLTFASLAANTPSREIPYANISRALQVPSEDVEMWTIDVIRAKLVEGRLSQRKKVFLVQRTAYRVFGDKQWRELYALLQQWKSTVANVSGVLRQQQAEVAAQRQRDVADLERKVAGLGLDGGRSGGYQRNDRRGGYQRENRTVEVEE